MASNRAELGAEQNDEREDTEALEADVHEVGKGSLHAGRSAAGLAEKGADEREDATRKEEEEEEEVVEEDEPIVWTALIDAGGWENDMEKVKELLDGGADIEGKASNGVRALHLAAQNGHYEIVKLLLEKGADVHAVFEESKLTPLHFAAHRGKADIVRLLLENGADHSARQHEDCTPLSLACLKGHREAARVLLEYGADATAADTDDWVPLEYVVKDHAQDVELITLLVQYGALKRKSGTILRVICAANEPDLNIVKLLLDNGADLEEPSSTGWRPLHIACSEGNVELVKLLLAKRAQQAVKAGEYSSLVIALSNEHIEVVKLLLKPNPKASKLDRLELDPAERLSTGFSVWDTVKG